ncbi:MAG: hypothetical protein OEZ36_12350 [Spirochaetota bacterium]|nr:hypothetical protein [Spirochaetota bacterium]
MRLTLLITILLSVSLSGFAMDIKAKYVEARAVKVIEVTAYYAFYVYNKYSKEMELYNPVSKKKALSKARYYKGIMDSKRRIIRVEEYHGNKMHGFYLYFYNKKNYSLLKTQYHYIGSYPNTDQKEFLRVDVVFDPESAGYFLDYYQQESLLKRDYYSYEGELIRSEEHSSIQTPQNEYDKEQAKKVKVDDATVAE